MIPRYSRPEMVRIWEPENRFRIWFEIEAHACDAQAALGVIPYENVGLNHWYCSPNKIWEYANAGVPILASRLHYLNAVIGRWDLGWTFSSDPSVADIVSVMRGITEEDLAAKRKNCQRFIQADNYPIHEPRLLDLFAGLGASKTTSETKQPLQQRRGAALESVEQR